MTTTTARRKEKPGRAILWRYFNRKPAYIIELVQLRRSTDLYARFLAYVIRYDPLQTTIMSILTSQQEGDRALRILKRVESNSPRLLPKLDSNFWSILTTTVRYTPTNFVYLRLALRRCRSCA